MADKKKIYMVTDPDGDRTVFDTEIAAKKFVIQHIKKYDMLDAAYIDHVKNIMVNEPDSTPPSYNGYIRQITNDIDELSDYEYFIEDFDVMTEEDI